MATETHAQPARTGTAASHPESPMPHPRRELLLEWLRLQFIGLPFEPTSSTSTHENLAN